MMKEKISEYLDGEGNREELEELLKKNPEAKEYFEQLSLMKSNLSEMRVQSPDVLNIILEKEKKHRTVFRYRFAFASIFAVAIVSILFFKFYNFTPEKRRITVPPQLKAPAQDNSFGITSVATPEINVNIGIRDDEMLLNTLENYGTVTGSDVKGMGGEEFQPEGSGPQKILQYRIIAKEIPKLVEDIEKIKGASVTLPETLPQDNAEVEIIINIYEK